MFSEGLRKPLNRQSIDVFLMGERLEVRDAVLSRQSVDVGMDAERGLRGSIDSLGMVIVGGVETFDHILDGLRVVADQVYDVGG